MHRDGGYLELDGDVVVAYGDGTAESLANLLWGPRPDSWRTAGGTWEPARATWRDEGGTR